MPFSFEESLESNDIKLIHTFEIDKPHIRHLSFKIDSTNNKIIFYPKEGFIVNSITLEGFSRIPPEISNLGYIKSSIEYYFKTKFSDKSIGSMTIVKDGLSQLKKSRDKYIITLSYKSLKEFKNRLTQLKSENQNDKTQAVKAFFHNEFPKEFAAPLISPSRKASLVLKNLDSSIIDALSSSEVTKFVDFFEQLLKKKYSSEAHKLKLFGAAKVKVDEIALSETIKKFEAMLADEKSEAEWGKFLHKHLFLIDSKYISVIPELNVVLAGARNVDFGLIDSQGYLDLFEIKKPSTPLLASSQDRGNYYWSTEAVKAITQIEKYLFNAERKAANLIEDVAREKKLDISLARPRAILIMGHSRQLDSKPKEEDFRILNNSLKNIEVITYDALLQRLKNQTSKLYI